ncbi:MAG: type III secretion system inner membrane ring subunit SctD [Chlamydiales bacterium]
MSAEFIAEEGVLKGLILALERGEEWTIGRDPNLCDIVVEDPKVERRHLVCRKSDEGYLIDNLVETNPVFVNNIPVVEPTLLKKDDIVKMGDSLFRFYPEGAPQEFGFEAPPPEEETPKEELPKEEAPKEELPKEDAAEKETSEEAALEEEALEGRETIFEEIEMAELPEMTIDLRPTTRFMLKVIAGPNTGAEFSLDLDRDYLIGTDTALCDVIFNDLSVSREHARLSISSEGIVIVEDLKSRNGVIVDGERIVDKKTLLANAVVGLGTSAFLLIDREAPSETITAPVFEAPSLEEEKVEEEVGVEKVVEEEKPKKPILPMGSLIISLIIGGLVVLLGIGMVSLLRVEEVEVAAPDYIAEMDEIIKNYPAVRYTYNKATNKLFLMGHVQTGVKHNELLYQLQGLPFIKAIDDNIVNDEAVWQEMNILLSKHAAFKGVSMHAPEPGVFVLNGYLQTEAQRADLMDYINIHFNYLNLLENRVVVEEEVMGEVASRLAQKGLSAVTAAFTNGELQLTGYIGSTQTFEYENLVDSFKEIPGVRSVRDYVVVVSPEQGVVDLNQRYPGRYRVTGYSKHGEVNINVVINGKILTRGDTLDDMTITSIQPNTIFLEKNLLKYKIEYNK